MDRRALVELIQNFNNKLSILTVLEHYDLDYDEESEGRYRALCPFHNDHTPSLILYTDNEHGQDSWWCPPCDETGDCFRFIQLMEGDVNFSEVVKIARDIAKNCTAKVANGKYKDLQRKRRQQKKLLLRAHELGVEYREWLKELKNTKYYEKACKTVDQIFEEMDGLLQGDDYKKVLDFLRERKKKLKKQKEK